MAKENDVEAATVCCSGSRDTPSGPTLVSRGHDMHRTGDFLMIRTALDRK